MLSKEILESISRIKWRYKPAVEDFSDRLNTVTAFLFILASVVISAKQYMFNPISCYIPVSPSGEEFKEFVSAYCWVHGTIPLHPDEHLPSNDDEWDIYERYRRISE
ncbi:Innexin [Fasciola gigantica]|uniref:Innexin n=1 Tax=Fasciola gigantica TaxID=46835 RepID=A0A504YP43_FASGI|nr:Innexin [Fasciola gigantica]